jgi:4-hydroxy-3-methylbut-2-enyl diphosphate reductase
VLVQSVVDRLIEWGAEVPEELQGQAESVVFSLPKELRLVDVSE